MKIYATPQSINVSFLCVHLATLLTLFRLLFGQWEFHADSGRWTKDVCLSRGGFIIFERTQTLTITEHTWTKSAVNYSEKCKPLLFVDQLGLPKTSKSIFLLYVTDQHNIAHYCEEPWHLHIFVCICIQFLHELLLRSTFWCNYRCNFLVSFVPLLHI